jgi:hypothetical protein
MEAQVPKIKSLTKYLCAAMHLTRYRVACEQRVTAHWSTIYRVIILVSDSSTGSLTVE